MITEEHLIHWINEILYATNGIAGNVNKKGMKGIDGLMVNDSHLSLEYIREKTQTIARLVGCIQHDMIVDKSNTQN